MCKSKKSVKPLLFSLFSVIMLVFLFGVVQSEAATALPDWIIDAYDTGLKLNGVDTGTGSFYVDNISPGYKDSFTITVNNLCSFDFLMNMEVKCLADSSTYNGDIILDEIILARQLVIKTYLDGVEITNFPDNSALILKTGTVLPVSLGDYDISAVLKNTSHVIRVDIELPGATTGNEYQDKGARFQWIFTMEPLGNDDDDEPDPKLTKVSDKDEVYVGDLITYTVKAKNNGSEESVWEDVIIIDALDPGLEFVGAVAGYTDIVDYDQAEHLLTISFGDISGGEEKEAKFTVRVTNAYNVGDLVENSVCSLADEYEVEDEDPPVVIDEEEEGEPDPKLTKVSDKDEVYVGDLITYTVTAKNNGSEESVWEDVIIIDALDPGLEFVGAVAGYTDIVDYDQAEHLLTINFGDISGGEEKEAKFTVRVTNAYNVGYLVENSVYSEADEYEVEDEDPPVVKEDMPGIRITKRGGSGFVDGVFYFIIEEQIEGEWFELDRELVSIDTRRVTSQTIELPPGVYRVTEVNEDGSPMTYYSVEYSPSNRIVNVVEEGLTYDIRVTNSRTSGGSTTEGGGGTRDRDTTTTPPVTPVTPPVDIPEPPNTDIVDDIPPLAEQIPDDVPPLGGLPQTSDEGVPLSLYITLAISLLGMGVTLRLRKLT